MSSVRDVDTYDPRVDGAQCDRCSLNGSPVVPSLGLASTAALACIAEAPGIVEESFGEPLIGPSGKEFDQALLLAGMRREECFLTNVCLCRPEGGSMRAHLSSVAAKNRGLKKKGLPLILPAPVACYPRLMHELQNVKGLLLMGAFARQMFYPKERGDSKLMASRGFPSFAEVKPANTDFELAELSGGASASVGVAGKLVRCLATVHPAYALRMGRWMPVFRSDVDKAVRAVRAQLRWRDPEMVFYPTPEVLINFLTEMDASSDVPAYDTETRFGLDWSQPKALRLLGIGTSKKVTCVPFQSVQEVPAYYLSPEQVRRNGEILVNWFAQKGVVAGHNEKFDRAVCTHAREYLPGFAMNKRVFDTVLAHHATESELPHTLEFLSARYTDAPAHKAVDHKNWHDDHEYHEYNMRDVAVTAFVAHKLAQDQRLIDQKVVLQVDHKLSDFCRGMEETGIWVDVKACAEQADVLLGEMAEARNDIHRTLHDIAALDGGERLGRALAKDWDFNPGSPPQIGKLLYGHLGISPLPEDQGGYTDTGRPSVEKPVLFQLCDRGVPQIVEDLIQRIIDYRGAQKLRSTYCMPLLPGSKRQESGDIRIGPTGRLHVVWNPHVVVSGRLSSSPNVMNIRESMRNILAAPPGHAFACCDKSQLEARVVAILAGEEEQIAAFLAGADIHKVNAVDLFGLKSVDDVTPELRQFTKTFVYAAQYLAGPKKIAALLRVFRDRNGKRPYRTYTAAEATTCYRRLWNSRQAIMSYHERNRALWAEVGYLAEAVHGRRRYFLDGATDEHQDEELANFPVQSCLPASTRVLVRGGMLPIGSVPDTGEVWTGAAWAAYEKLYRGPWELAEIELDNGQVLRCDTRHQVLVVGTSAYEFRRYAELAQGDRVCLSLAEPLEFGDESAVDAETAYWLGFAIGNGCTSPRPSVLRRGKHTNALTVTFGDRKGRYIGEDKALAFANYLSSRGYRPQKPQRYRHSVTIGVAGIDFRQGWSERYGYPWGVKSADKTTPDVIWRASLAARQAFLLGLLDADGCVGSGGIGRSWASSPVLGVTALPLLREVQVIARASGVTSRLAISCIPGQVHQLHFNRGHLTRLGYGAGSGVCRDRDRAPGFVIERLLAFSSGIRHLSGKKRYTLQNARFRGYVGIYTLRDFVQDNAWSLPLYATSRVVSVRPLGRVEDTYTLSVAGHEHRFDSEGIISKNTAAADVNAATYCVLEAFPNGYAGPGTGIIHQCHDSLVLETTKDRVLEDGKKMAKLMFSRLGRMSLPVELKVGKNYRDLKKVPL